MPFSWRSPLIAIGLDVGGTKIAGGLVDLTSGEILQKRVIPTLPKRGGPLVLHDSLNLARELKTCAELLNLSVAGIGVGVAELVDPAGNVTSSHTIQWSDLPVRNEFSALAPAVVEADVRAAALAEAVLGIGRSYKNFAYVTVGTGISYSLVKDGVPYAGSHGNALVLASGPMTSVCPRCNLQFQSVLEDLASGPALLARYNVGRPQPAGQAEAVLAAVEDGDVRALEVVRSAGEALGSHVGFLVNVLDPEAIIVGGGLGMAGGLYWESFVGSVRRHIWSDVSQNIPILMAGLGPDAGLIGAALASAV